MKSHWTDDRVAKLREGAASGRTAREIADVLGVTRNSVLGKAMRMGVTLPMTERKLAHIVAAGTSRKGEKRPPKPQNWAGHRKRSWGAPAFTEEERLLAVTLFMAGASSKLAAGSIGAAPQTLLKLWMKDPALVGRAADIVEGMRPNKLTGDKAGADIKAGLTPQQANLLRLIGDLTVNDVPPTHAVLAQEMGLTKGNIHRLLSGLFERGHVTWEHGKHRSLRLVDALAGKSSAELLATRDKIDAVLVERMA